MQERYQLELDWSGLEQKCATTWLNNELIFSQPLFFVEFGISLLGALQVWRTTAEDQPGAVARYHRSLALSDSDDSIPEL